MQITDFPRHRTLEELQLGLATVLEAPVEEGRLELIVRRPEENGREILEEGQLNQEEGLQGDHWCRRFCKDTLDGSPHPEKQLNLISARALALVAPERKYWHLAGDQLIVEFDLTQVNAPAGTRLAIGDKAVIEVTAPPHTGCEKFSERFGVAATRFFCTGTGLRLNLRGICARVIQPGIVRTGDGVRKLG